MSGATEGLKSNGMDAFHVSKGQAIVSNMQDRSSTLHLWERVENR